MFRRTPPGVYESTLLHGLPWVRHGFASRHAGAWPGEYTRVKQIHSAIVAVADDHRSCLGQGDAIVTNVPGRWVGVRTADCVPLLLADSRTRAVAAVHAGWRGTVANVAGAAIRSLKERYGTDSADLYVAIGPCISVCCFEVGPEVIERFAGLLPEVTPGRNIDLVEANRRQLLLAGVHADHIETSGLCTMCDPGEFHSFRRDREISGRMVAAICAAPEKT